MKTYMCYYCDTDFEAYAAVIDHLVRCHVEHCLKYRELELDEHTGNAGYRTKTYTDVIPNEGEIFISSDQRVGIYRSDRAKKSKLNTPLKLSREIDQNEIEITKPPANKTDISELLSEMEIGSIIDETDATSKELDELMAYLPGVIDNLRENGHLESYKRFCELISKNEFPMKNIFFQLFLDVIDWFSTDNTSNMRYCRPETRRFWEVGYRLFKGKFLRFMSGPRSLGQVVEGRQDKGFCSSAESLINFAIPTLPVMCQDKLSPIMPGVMEDSISVFASHSDSKFVKIGIDGKKIARVKGKIAGDIDCWGFEPEPTLSQRTERFKCESQEILDINQLFQSYDDNGRSTIPSNAKTEVCDKLVSVVTLIGKRIKDLREVLLRFDFGIDQFVRLGDCQSKDWKKSKYAPIISSLKVAKYDTEQAIATGLQVVNEICQICASLNGQLDNYCYSGIVDIDKQQNFHKLKTNVTNKDPRYVIQKSEEWFKIRSESIVTGSTCNTALGLGQLRQQQAHFDKVIRGIENTKIFTEEQKSNMEYGTTHEIDGIAIIVTRVLPSIFPMCEYYEEGCIKVKNMTNNSFLVASPDGSFKTRDDQDLVMMYENKCKVKNAHTTAVYYEIPKYYITQLMCEMFAYNFNSLLFSCWSEKSTTVFKVSFHKKLWQSMWKELNDIYGVENPRRPTKFRDDVPVIKALTEDFRKNNVSFIGEFPSCKVVNEPLKVIYENGSDTHVSYYEDTYRESHDTSTYSVLCVLRGLQTWHENVYGLCRTSATEILMFMVNDLDRKYRLEINNAHPVAYALKGASMSNDTFGKMVGNVIKKCEEKGLRVIATSSDGQWHKYGVRNSSNEPLTVLQLQRDTWKEQKSKTKSTHLKEIRNKYKVTSLNDVRIEKKSNGPLIVYGHLTDEPICVFAGPSKIWLVKKK